MHQIKCVRKILTQSRHLLRAFLICILLVGSLVAVAFSLHPNVASAQKGSTVHNVPQQIPQEPVPSPTVVIPTITVPVIPSVTVTAIPSVTVTALPSVTVTAIPSVIPTASVTATASVTPTASVTATASVTPTASVTATASVTPTASVTVTASVTPTATVTPIPTRPAFFITKTHQGGNVFSLGQNINYTIVAANLPTAAPETATNSVVVTDVIPAGLSNLAVLSSNNWAISLTSSTSPATLTATYIGSYPVAPGTVLPQIAFTGTLNSAAIPVFTNTATITSANDPNPALNTSVDSISVTPQQITPTVTVTVVPPTTTIVPPPLTPTIPVTVTVLPTMTATAMPTMTATVLPTMTVIPTATVTPGPDLSLVKTHLGGDTFKVGDKVTFVLLASSSSQSTMIMPPSTITVTDVIPAGLKDLKAYGNNWSFDFSDTQGPAILTATYTGTFPVQPGTTLSAITITGKLTSDAVPSLTNTATVDTQGNIDPNSTASDTIYVEQNQHHNNGNGNNDNDQNNNDNNNNNNNNDNDNHNHNGHNNHDDNGNDHNNNQNTSGNNANQPTLPNTGSDIYPSL